MSRRALCLLLPLLLISLPLQADEAAIREKLRSRVKVHFENAPLRDVLKDFSQQADVNFWIAETEIEALGGKLDHEVTLDWGEMQLDSALHFILQTYELQAAPDEHDIYVDTMAGVSGRYTTKVYPIGKILDGMQREFGLRFATAQERRDILTHAGGSGIRGSVRNYFPRLQDFVGQGFFQLGFSIQPNAGGPGIGAIPPTIGETIDPKWLTARPISRTELATWLELVVRETVPDCWEQCDGVGGNSSIAGEALIITIESAKHDNAAALLSAIERIFTKVEPPVSQWAIRPGYPIRDDESLKNLLDQIGDLTANDQPLGEVLTQLAKQHGFRLWIDRSGIESDGGTLSTSVNFAATQLPYREILTRLLHQYELDYVIEEGSTLR